MNRANDIPELRLDRTKIKVFSGFDDSDEIEYWRNASVEERFQNIERLRRQNYGARATARLQRVIRVVKREGR
jgi:hypothetical protein